ncbi:hypothetical protein EP47_03580 [Legionella norrlandica]|uniref:Glycosyltransferase n=1 Tax=Legionella norrlandica TaxID=1498499 RepID=A0A0A2SX63_9GAMM|nr:hypothetical protein EP47_03580 [Legionella norrlandica]
MSGPPAVLQLSPSRKQNDRRHEGLICENLHSVRLNVAGDFKTDFIKIFKDFCTELAKNQKTVTLRPHPGGQFILKNNIPIPPNVTLNNNPIYKVDLTRFAYGISAPSSILIDMILAGIPVAIWREETGVMDCNNYNGLTEISSLQDWLDFSKEATLNPEKFIKIQQRFLENQKVLTNPKDVYYRFVKLFNATENRSIAIKTNKQHQERILFIANGLIPTLILSLVNPLKPLIQTGKFLIDILTEAQINAEFKGHLQDDEINNYLLKRFLTFKPTQLVFCRYSGPGAEYILRLAEQKCIPTIYTIDDDILNIPLELGEKKYNFHNNPKRLRNVRYLLDNVSLVHCSTKRLQHQFEKLRIKSPIYTGKIFHASKIVVPAAKKPVIRKFGYMGIDHTHDLGMILPSLVEFLRRNPSINFEIFGPIPIPPELKEFKERITTVPMIRDYEEFMKRFAKCDWDVGICPLAPIHFNYLKTNLKWLEYTALGIAVIASRNTVYDECCADRCGILADTQEEWLCAFEKMANSPKEHFEQVCRAQKKLEERFSIESQCAEVLNIFEMAKTNNNSPYAATS